MKQMSEIREVLFQTIRGVSNRGIARSLGLSRNTINQYIRLAKKLGLSPATSNEEVHDIALQMSKKLYENKGRASNINKKIANYHETIKSYLQEKNMTQTQVHRKLAIVASPHPHSFIELF
jgi:FixJ family two-component response regulator